MENEERLAIKEAVAQGVIQGLNGNKDRLFGNGAIRPDSFPSQRYPDWTQWKTHFCRVGRAIGWTELQGLQAVPVCLIGYALDEYNAAPRDLKEPVEGADALTLAAPFNHMGREMGMMRNNHWGKEKLENFDSDQRKPRGNLELAVQLETSERLHTRRRIPTLETNCSGRSPSKVFSWKFSW